jgi:hypothetical protein
MNRRTGVILLIAIAVLGGIAFYINANPEVAANPTETSVAVTTRPLWTVSLPEITGLTVSDSAKGLTFVADVDSTGAWKISQPQAGDADFDQMAATVTSLTNLTITQDVAEVTNLADFGLEAPAYAIEVRRLSGDPLRLTVGQKTVTGFMYYVLPQGSTTPVLVSSTLLDTILGLPSAPPLATPTAPPTEGTPEPLPTLPLPATATP